MPVHFVLVLVISIFAAAGEESASLSVTGEAWRALLLFFGTVSPVAVIWLRRC